jgi:Domain of unknown function (DUF4388)
VDLPSQIVDSMDNLSDGHVGDESKDFEHLLRRVRELVDRRAAQINTKGETLDLLREVLFGRLNKGFQEFIQSGELVGDARKKADFFVGSILSGTVLDEIALILDRVLGDAAMPHDYHLAGRVDFIRLHELLQLLSSGKHTGRLMVERPAGTVDLYMLNGSIGFVDPHEFTQRMIRGKGLSPWREIPEKLSAEANRVRLEQGTPILLNLKVRGYFKEEEFKNQLRAIGSELIYDLLMRSENMSFSYKALEEMPEWVTRYNAALPIMPLMLEGHKRIDDWRVIAKAFPDLEEPIMPAPDLFTQIAEMSLGVVEIKVLTLVNGESTFNDIRRAVGLNLYDLGVMLLHFAQEGIIEPPGGKDSLDRALTAEESMEAVEEALMVNEALEAIPDSLDAVFGEGDDGQGFGLGYLEAAREEGDEGS